MTRCRVRLWRFELRGTEVSSNKESHISVLFDTLIWRPLLTLGRPA
jgi:hypothetical protein